MGINVINGTVAFATMIAQMKANMKDNIHFSVCATHQSHGHYRQPSFCYSLNCLKVFLVFPPDKLVRHITSSEHAQINI